MKKTPVHGREVNLQNCPVVEASKWVGDFWNLWILRNLLDGPLRFSELQTAIPTINKATLSHKLHDLTDIGLITRQVSDTTPVAVTYSLSANGKAIKPVLDSIESFAQKAFK